MPYQNQGGPDPSKFFRDYTGPLATGADAAWDWLRRGGLFPGMGAQAQPQLTDEEGTSSGANYGPLSRELRGGFTPRRLVPRPPGYSTGGNY